MKPVVWVGSSLENLRAFPRPVQRTLGWALQMAQLGGKHPDAKPLKGFGGAGVLEMVENYEDGTYRGVYTVRLGELVYVLHCFQKKSRHGIETPKREMDLIRARLRRAEEHYEREWVERR